MQSQNSHDKKVQSDENMLILMKIS